MAEAPEGLAFLNALAEMATRLATDGVEIHSVTYRSQVFGSWEIEAGRRRTRVRVTWEGKDRHLSVATAQLATGSSERAWQLAEEHDFRNRRPDLVQLLGTVQAAIRAPAGD